MVRPYYKVDCVNGQWAIVIAKGKKAGTVIKTFSSSEEAWNCYNNFYTANEVKI